MTHNEINDNSVDKLITFLKDYLNKSWINIF